jgi:hypothetical protein
MKPISFLDFRPLPGDLVEWTVSAETGAAAMRAPIDPVPLSYNQELHLRSALAARRLGASGNPWIGASFDIEGGVDLNSLGLAFAVWMRRHEALRSGFRDRDDTIERFTLSADDVDLRQEEASRFTSSELLHDHLDRRFASGTNPFSWPPLVLGVVSRETRSTVFVALDHVAGDGYSLALAVWELQTSYEAFLEGQVPVLPETGSFLELCLAERARGAEISATDPAVGAWREFIRACGGTSPTFPLDLGVTAGDAWPQSVYTRLIVGADEAQAFEEVCEGAGSGMFAGILACMAISIHELTGQLEFRTVTPMQTRRQSNWRHAMGWFVTCSPLSFSLAGAGSFADILNRAQLSVNSALRLARVPALRIVELLGDEFRITRRDLFSMVSFTDYRTFPGAGRHDEWNASTMGRVTEADDSHVWISRQHDGLHISIRHPDTPTAGVVLEEYAQLIGTLLAHEARGANCPLASDAVGWTRRSA